MLSFVRRQLVSTLFGLCLWAMSVAPAAGQTDQQSPSNNDSGPRLTPFVAMGDDYAFGGGASLLIAIARRVSLEAEASLGVDAARSSLSLVYDFARFGALTTYVAGGAGIQRDEVDQELLASGWYVVRKKTEFAVNIGAGGTVPVGPRWSYRVDFRWYNPKAEWPESWRVYNGLSLRFGTNTR